MTSPAQVALTPAGSPFAPSTPSLVMPVVEVVAWVIAVRTVLTHRVGVEDAAPAVISGIVGSVRSNAPFKVTSIIVSTASLM